MKMAILLTRCDPTPDMPPINIVHVDLPTNGGIRIAIWRTQREYARQNARAGKFIVGYTVLAANIDLRIFRASKPDLQAAWDKGLICCPVRIVVKIEGRAVKEHLDCGVLFDYFPEILPAVVCLDDLPDQVAEPAPGSGTDFLQRA